MTTRPWLRVPPVATLPFLLLTGCATAGFSVSPSTVMNAVIFAGEVIGSAGSSSGSGGSSSGGGEARFPRSPEPTATASRVLESAHGYLGVPYVWGGTTPEGGFDCSGFTRYVFAKQGIRLPRTSRDQAKVGQSVPLDGDALRPGDLLLFAEPGEAISHVAIYVGNGEIIHASSAGHGVRYDDINSGHEWYVQNMVAVRRIAR